MSITAGPEQTGVQARGRRWGLALELLTFNLLLLATAPMLACWLLWRSLVRRKPIGCWRHRLGLVPRLRNAGGPRVWLHAVSAGEMAAAKPVLDALCALLPGSRIALSTVTPAGMVVAEKTCQAADARFYFPFDAPCCISQALLRVRPDLVVVTEKELWPNFLGLARLLGARVLVVNGRVSDRMLGRSKWAPGFVKWLYQLPDLLCVQSSHDAQRLAALGVPSSRVEIAGNTKVDGMSARDLSVEADLAGALDAAAGETWLVAGSTHAGEEEVVVEAFELIRERLPGARLLLAPRHLERVPAVSAMLAQRGFRVVRRSEYAPTSDSRRGHRARASAEPAEQKRPAPADAPAVVLDTIGELRSAYALGVAGFVGGTFAPIGGHNLLEPIAAGRPVIFGPHTENCADVAEMVGDAHVGFPVTTAEELAEQFVRIATDAGLRSRIAGAAQRLMDSQRGAAERCAQAAERLLSMRSA